MLRRRVSDDVVRGRAASGARRLRDVAALCLLLGLGCSAPLADIEPYEGEAVILPVKPWREYFMLPLSMGGAEDRTMWFLFDTGANFTLVDPDSLRAISDWRGGADQSVNLRDVHCGDLVFNKLPARTFELDAIERALGRKLDGILGFPAFRQLLLTLDYGAMELRVADGALPRPDGETIFKARKTGNNRPWVELKLAGESHTVLLDSGSGGRISLKGVDPDAWAIAPVAVGTSMGVDGLEQRRVGRVADSAWLMGQEFECPAVQAVRSGSNLIGTELLQHFVLTFDQRQGRIRVERLADAPIPAEPILGTGVLKEVLPEGFLVRMLTPGSPAEAAGIQVGDLIIEFSGARYDQLPAGGPEALQDGERSFHRFRLMRDGEELLIEVDVAELVPVPLPQRLRE